MDFQKFKGKYQKVPVEHYSSQAPNEPMVSVSVQSYQHVDYIEACLNGILKQETDFTFEILLGEDGSTDGTRDICIEYAKKNSDKIRLFLHRRENNISVYGQPTGRFNWLYNLFSANGKYIALCEGDDYWTDPLKLQKQVDFMEKNSEYSLCSGGYREKINKGFSQVIHKNIVDESKANCHGFTFDLTDLAEVWLTKTLTVLFRKDDYYFDTPFNYEYFRDVHIYHDLLKSGKGYYFQTVFGVYNMHSGGLHSLIAEKEKKEQNYMVFKEMFEKDADNFTNVKFIKATLVLAQYYLIKEKDLGKARNLLKESYILSNNKISFLRYIFKEICKYPIHKLKYS